MMHTVFYFFFLALVETDYGEVSVANYSLWCLAQRNSSITKVWYADVKLHSQIILLFLSCHRRKNKGSFFRVIFASVVDISFINVTFLK